MRRYGAGVSTRFESLFLHFGPKKQLRILGHLRLELGHLVLGRKPPAAGTGGIILAPSPTWPTTLAARLLTQQRAHLRRG